MNKNACRLCVRVFILKLTLIWKKKKTLRAYTRKTTTRSIHGNTLSILTTQCVFNSCSFNYKSDSIIIIKYFSSYFVSHFKIDISSCADIKFLIFDELFWLHYYFQFALAVQRVTIFVPLFFCTSNEYFVFAPAYRPSPVCTCLTSPHYHNSRIV